MNDDEIENLHNAIKEFEARTQSFADKESYPIADRLNEIAGFLRLAKATLRSLRTPANIAANP